MARSATQKMHRLVQRVTWLLVLLAFGTVAFVYLRWVYREQRFNVLIERIATQQGADKFLIKAVMRQESNFDPFAYSSKGAIGLMQVMGDAGQDWAWANKIPDFTRDLLWDPANNIGAGTWYLQRALRRWEHKEFADRIPFALAEYNAGYGNVLRWLPHGRDTTAEEFKAAITYPGVRRYIDSVTDYYQHYREQDHL